MNSSVDNLIAGYLTDAATPDEIAQLEALLRSDAQVRARFAEWCCNDVILRQVVTMNAEDVGTATYRRRVRPRTRSFRKRRTSMSNAWMVLAAAAMIAVVVTVVIMQSPRHGTATPIAVVPLVEHPVLVFVGGEGRLTTSDGDVPVGSQIARAQTIHVHDAQVALRWLADDSQFVLQPGSILRADADGPRLEQGQLDATVSKQTQGRFRIETAHTTVSVLGTRFEVAVKENQSHIAVSEGRVRVFARGDGTTTELVPGEQISASTAGFIQPAERSVIAFVPVVARSLTPIGPRWLGRASISLSELPAGQINLIVECSPQVKSVACSWDKVGSSNEQILPFCVLGNVDTSVRGWTPVPGTYYVEVRPFAQRNLKEPIGKPVKLELTITD